MKNPALPLALLLLTSLSHAAQPGYFRFPALRGDTVVFTAEGDLWTVPVGGGAARRLTTHPGAETHAAISPDGKTVAFTGAYEGSPEVYVMPLEGGAPKRLTWEGEDAKVAGWTPDGRVLYTTKAFSTLPNQQLAAVDPATGDQTPLPLSQAAEGVYDDAGATLFFTRLPFQGSSTKRYQGGTAQNLWRLDQGAAEAVPLTADFPGTSKNPMWGGDRVYFLSDRSGVMNLWSMNRDGGDAKQLTAHKEYDAKSARMDGGRIVYQHGADLRLFRVADGADAVIPVSLPSDFDQTRERQVEKPMSYLTSAALSPDGDRVALTARGQVFVAPAEAGGRLVAVPKTKGERQRNALFFPDGKSLLAQTDATGEVEFIRLPANGVGGSTPLTTDGKIFRFRPVIAPGGRWIAWHDKDRKLWVRDLTAAASQEVAVSLEDEFEDLTWSPDGQWLAYVETAANTSQQIRLFRPSDSARAVITSERVSSHSPAWSPDGKWLYFLSERELRSRVSGPWGPRQPEPYFTESTRVYCLSLKKGGRPPFLIPDELHPAGSAEEAKDKEKDAKSAEKPPIQPDLDGLAGRLFELPLPAGNYSALTATDKFLFLTSTPPDDDDDDEGGGKNRAVRVEIAPRPLEMKTFAVDVKSWEISANGKRALIRRGDSLYVAPADGDAPAKLEKAVPLDGWALSVDPREEWRQIHAEAWRMLRDYFYDPAMHGNDWIAIKKKYEPLIARVADRADLSDVLHEMAGELAALHIYVRHGDMREGPEDTAPASLGARLSRDPAAGGWKVERLFRTDPDYPAGFGPLLRPDSEIKEGDIITAINGVPSLTLPHPGAPLRKQAGLQVLLEVKSPGAEAARSLLVKPVAPAAAADIRYASWEYSRRQETERLGEGRIGYVHLRAMGGDDIATWARDFYPVFNRQGLIIDVRHNRGGNIDSWILNRLMRKAWFYWSRRSGNPYWNMQQAFRGHVAVLCDEYTASDGEAFSEGFRRLGLGKVIGTRTWGGEIWLSAKRWLVDNGMCTAAESGVYGPEGAWLIEGHGVDPDIVVDNLPRASFDGRDAQLEAAVKHLQELIAQDPRPVPPTPAKPRKTP